MTSNQIHRRGHDDRGRLRRSRHHGGHRYDREQHHVANNFVAGVNGSNYSSFSNSSSMGIGIGVVGNGSTLTTTTGGVKLYHNSVNMAGSYSYAAPA